MSLNQPQLALTLAEIAPQLQGGVIRKVYSDGHADSILLEIRVPGANRVGMYVDGDI